MEIKEHIILTLINVIYINNILLVIDIRIIENNKFNI